MTPQAVKETAADLEEKIRAVAFELARAYPGRGRHPRRAAEDMAMALTTRDPDLRAALFRFVDVAPACAGTDELTEHLEAFLAGVEGSPARAVVRARRGLGRGVVGAASARAVRAMAQRFIVAETPGGAAPVLARLWRSGAAASVDLLGEATVTPEEADRYAARCHDVLATLTDRVAAWPERELLERDGLGPLARVNLSVKVSALTPLVRPNAPEVGRADAAGRLRELLRHARDAGAHLHVDMESMDSRDMVQQLVLDLLAEDEFRDGPSAGMVLQAYLTDSGEQLEEVLEQVRAAGRTTPLTVRLVKGAYWDHETVSAAQHGWTAPVFARKHECDRNFERLTRRLLAERGVRLAVASHNLRSIAHAIAYSRALGRDDRDLEIQVLRGLGDDLADALARRGFRVRVYCPIGDLVAGMAYLVRRLLENSANDSFLAARASGRDLDELLVAP